MIDYSNVHLCVQRFHADNDVHANIHKQIIASDYSMAIFLRSALWNPNDTITISFLPMDPSMAPEWYPLSIPEKVLTSQQMNLEHQARAAPSLVDAIKLVVNEAVVPAVPKLHLKFVDQGGMVRVRLQKGGGSSSLVGKACLTAPSNEYTITFGWMDPGTIIHEFGHALGLLHEHQSPFGGIQWNRPAVYAWAQQTQGWDKETTDTNILDTYPSNEITGSIFDPKSVMLYFFPASLTLNNQGTTQNLRYSETDLKYLASTYDSTYNPNLLTGEKVAALFARPTTWVIVAAAIIMVIILIYVL